MPVIARFYGLIIKMFFQRKEHNPPHFHAVYGEYVGAINIRNPRYVGGRFASEGSGPGEGVGDTAPDRAPENMGDAGVRPTSPVGIAKDLLRREAAPCFTK